MSAHTLLFLLTYASILIFLISVLYRGYKLFTMPIHLRWEIYPVGHEAGERGKYGGSYFEELDWWTKPIHSSMLAEAKIMGPEILLLKGVWEHNRPLWFLTFPFHFGLYMLIATTVLLLGGAVFQAFGGNVGAEAGLIGKALYGLPILTGFLGYTLGLFGSLALLYRRITDPELNDYTALADYFNLLLFIVAIGSGLAAWLFVDHSFVLTRGFIVGLITLTPAALGSKLLGIALALAVVTIAYIPLTHMSHFFTKYFMYHHIKWNDTPNQPGSKIEAQVNEVLGFKPTWAAKHVGADGTKTWAEIATTNPTVEDK